MSLINLISEALFGTAKDKKEKSARESAKERLHLVLVNDRAGQIAPDFMPKMRQELLEVLKKYLPIADEDDVEFNFARKENTDIMEMSVSLEKTDEKRPFRQDSVEKSDK